MRYQCNHRRSAKRAINGGPIFSGISEGSEQVSTQKLALVDLAVKTKFMLDSIDLNLRPAGSKLLCQRANPRARCMNRGDESGQDQPKLATCPQFR
jgi:hypothetical protein